MLRPYFLTLKSLSETEVMIVGCECVRCKVFRWIDTTLEPRTISEDFDSTRTSSLQDCVNTILELQSSQLYKVIDQNGHGTNSVTVLEEPGHG